MYAPIEDACDVNGQPRVWVVGGGGYLMSFDAGGRKLWQECITDSGHCAPGVGTWGGVAIADINHDGRLDAVVQPEGRMRVYDALTGSLQTSARSAYPQAVLASSATPTIASVDGKTWIVQVNIGDANGNLRPDGVDDLLVTVWTTGRPLGDAPWPTFKGNMARTSGPLPEPPHAVNRGGRVCTSVSGGTGGGAIVNLTPVEAPGPGFGLLVTLPVLAVSYAFAVFMGKRIHLDPDLPRLALAEVDHPAGFFAQAQRILDILNQHANLLTRLRRLVFVPLVARDQALALVADVDEDEVRL